MTPNGLDAFFIENGPCVFSFGKSYFAVSVGTMMWEVMTRNETVWKLYITITIQNDHVYHVMNIAFSRQTNNMMYFCFISSENYSSFQFCLWVFTKPMLSRP